ncbi:hypothetical protein [Streptomyces sp. NPDC002530]
MTWSRLSIRPSFRDALTAHPALAGVLADDDLAALTDPSGYTGAAGPLVDHALRRGPARL